MLDTHMDTFLKVVTGIVLISTIIIVVYTVGSQLDWFNTESNAGFIRDYLSEQNVEYEYRYRKQMVIGESIESHLTAIPNINTNGNSSTTLIPLTSSETKGPHVAFFEIEDVVVGISEFKDDLVVYDVLPAKSVSANVDDYPHFKDIPTDKDREELIEYVAEIIDFGERELFTFDMTQHIER